MPSYLGEAARASSKLAQVEGSVDEAFLPVRVSFGTLVHGLVAPALKTNCQHTQLGIARSSSGIPWAMMASGVKGFSDTESPSPPRIGAKV
jgi:hypothetical protein